MQTVLPVIRLLVVIQAIQRVCCQNGYSDQDLMRYQQMVNDGAETITSYNTNIQRDPNSQSLSSVNVQYHLTDDDKNEDYTRADRSGRIKKVFRIKNPFQREGSEQQQNTETDTQQDSATGASNQYTAMQYSLPPDEFLQRMRAESQFYQQPTQAPPQTYTATPQPLQYQYSTIMASEYNPNQPTNPITEDSKLSHPQQYQSNQNYQYNVQSSYNLNGIQSTTPAPYLSTPISNNYVITPNNPYVSSSSPMLSNSQNIQQYVSSPLSIQNGSPDYNNRVTSTISNNPYDSGESVKKMQIDHYDNSATGVRYPNSIQQQLSNDYPTSTPMPTSSPYSEPWQSNNINSLSKSLHELSFSQFPNNNGYSSNQQDMRNDQTLDSDTHRAGNMPAANNLYLNYVQPDYHVLNQVKSRTRDTEQETSQPEVYSHGDYGWKLFNKRPSASDNYNSATQQQQRYQGFNLQSPDGGAVSQMSFHMDTGKPNKYEQISKSSPDSLDAQEFAKAAAKAQQLQQAQQAYANSYGTSYNPFGSSDKYYGSLDKQKSRTYPENSNSNSFYGNSQTDLITASPYLQFNSQSYETRSRQPFDHAKALKNIVPIVDSNGVPESQSSSSVSMDSYNKFNHYKEQMEQSLKQFYKPLTDAYYKDKNTIYGFNIQTKPDHGSDNFKQSESNLPFYAKQQNHDSFNHNSYGENKRYSDSLSSSLSYPPIYHSDNTQSSANVQQQSVPRNQNQPTDIASILKFNDIPNRIQQASDFLKIQNEDQSNIPTPLPLRINQNVASHQIDVASNILSKLMAGNKQQGQNRPDIDFSNGSPISTINGFKVANPFNVDLKLVSDMLKGKPSIDDSQLLSLRDQFNKPSPLKMDFSQIQQLLLKNDNNLNLASSLNDGLGIINSPYFDLFSTGRYPYQGVKYSRSQEEEEPLIPIADASSTHPIGAVVEQDPVSEREVSTDSELTAQEDETVSHNFDEDRPKSTFVSGHRTVGDRHRRPNSLAPGRRRPYQRKYPKTNIDEPYPLLKPPPPKRSRNNGARHSLDQRVRRQRANKPKVMRILNTEPLFEAESEDYQEPSVPTLLKPPPVANAKSDKSNENS